MQRKEGLRSLMTWAHPVIVGKRALPALALTNDGGILSGMSVHQPGGVPFARLVTRLGHAEDIAMGFSVGGEDANVIEALSAAKQQGSLTVALTGGEGGTIARSAVDYCFVVPSSDAMVIQETHETLYHILWELVHVFFEHEGLLK